MVRVWDPLLRVFHWGLAAAFAVAYATSGEVQPVHELAGYGVAGLVAFRVFWGLAGPRYARFGQFLRGPGETLRYLGDMAGGRERRYLGHNPAGAAMVVAQLLVLAGITSTGLMMQEPARTAMLPAVPQVVAAARADDGRGHGEAGEEGEEGEVEGPLKEVHEALATLMLFLIALHLGGVALASWRHHENLARAMVTGEKRAPGPDDIA